jgi:hypothetical protein
MIKKLGLAVALSLLAAPAFAACTNPLVIKDGSAANISMSMTSNADGFCQYNFNMAQINGVVPLMGNGATGTGSPRVTIANDNTVPTGWPTATNQTAAAAAKGEGATGAGVPSGAQYMGLNSSGNLLGWAAKAGNTYAATDVVPGVAVVNTQVSVTPGDGITTTIYGTAPASPVIGVPLLWNGTTYDRWKSAGATGVAAVRPTDGTRNAIIDPCEATLQSYAPISITTAATTRIVAPSASNKTYICHLFLTSAAADNVGIVEGTGGTCGTGTAGVIGGTTAANGPNFAANGGVALHAGGKVAVAQTAGTNVDLCLITSAATPLAGGIKYVQAP